MTGYVDDIRPWVDRAACFIVPLRVGGGTRLKILDAWAMGKAVVSTSRGCEGLDVRNGENMLVADGPEAFARAVGSVLTDRALRDRLGSGGRETVVARYEWRVIGSALHQAYARAMSVGVH
jgi:glycosyltransferase involved in cell wall biosynthesis